MAASSRIVLAQPHLTESEAAALRPCAPGTVPGFGTFYLATFLDSNQPPTPFNPYPDLPAYLLPDGSFLVDDTSVSYVVLTPQAQIAALRNALLPQQRRMSEGMEPPVEPGGTNPPPDLTPQLVPPELIPTNGTFSLLQQSNWPPFPYDPFPGADVYVLYDGSFIIDDTAVDYSSLNWSYDGGGSPIAPQGYPYASGLWIEILGISNAQTRLILHGTTAGTDYTLLSRDSLAPSQPWNAEQAVVGAGGQDWTPVQAPTFGRSHLLFWAQVGTVTPQAMWLQALGISNGYLNVILHGTLESTVYELVSIISTLTTTS